MNRARVLVTGASGFIGRTLCSTLGYEGYSVRAVQRKASGFQQPGKIEYIAVGDIGPSTQWDAALSGIDSVVHLAARVHVMREEEEDPLNLYRQINTVGTERLARAAARAGVRRLVYVSTIKVNGESTGDSPFRATDIPQPSDPYAISKWEAERALHRVAQETGLEVVIVRPPLVYGPDVRGNFLALLRIVKQGIPLPLASIRNARSLVGRDNLVDLLVRCVVHPAARGQTFLVSDGAALSTPELIRKLAVAMGKRARLLPFPTSLLKGAATLAGRQALCERLCGSLVVDIAHTTERLGWQPPVGVDSGLRLTAQWYLRA